MLRYRLFLKQHWKLAMLGVAMILIGLLAGWMYLLSQQRPVIRNFDECVAAGYDVTNLDPQTCTDGKQTWADNPAPTPTPKAAFMGTNQDFSLLVTGNSKGTYPKSELVITSAAAWQNFWGQVHAGVRPLPALLPVDFSKENVVVIVQGPVATTGHAVDLESITVSQDPTKGAQVDYKTIVPGENCKPKAEANNQYIMVTTAKINGPVKFINNASTRKCAA